MKYLVKQFFSLILLFIALGSFVIVSAQEPPKPYRDDQDIRADLKRAVSVAGRDHRHVLVQFGGNWCPWCLRFHQLARTERTIDSLLRTDYIYIMANVPQDKKKRDYALFAEFGYPNRFGYPVFVVLDGKGKVLHIQESGILEHCRDKGYDTAKVVNFLRMWNPRAVDPSTYK